MIKKYKQYIKETIDHSDIDPWGEEDWEFDNPYEKMDLIVATTLGYDELPFLFSRKKRYDGRFYDIYYSVCVIRDNMIEFNDYPQSKDIYPVENKNDILLGNTPVAYVTDLNMIKTKKLEDLCLFMNINIDKIKIIE
jgi:hypothetical protein